MELLLQPNLSLLVMSYLSHHDNFCFYMQQTTGCGHQILPTVPKTAVALRHVISVVQIAVHATETAKAANQLTHLGPKCIFIDEPDVRAKWRKARAALDAAQEAA